MPGNNPGDGGDYYCDANLGNNIWCPEYDTWEGNKHTMAATLHTCNGGNGYWDSCDRGGCQTNAFNVNSNLMCPEDRCTINTNRLVSQLFLFHFIPIRALFLGLLPFLTSKPQAKLMFGLNKKVALLTLMFAIEVITSQIWPVLMVEWFLVLRYGVVMVSTWDGWMV